MVILLKIKRRDFFQRDSISILVSRTVKTWKFKLLYFEMKHVTGMETCTRISVLFIFNLVQIRIRKTSLSWLYNLMTSLWKQSINQHSVFTIETDNCHANSILVCHGTKDDKGGQTFTTIRIDDVSVEPLGAAGLRCSIVVLQFRSPAE